MWYKKDYRRVFMDMHLNDSNEEEYLSKLDVASFVGTLSNAHVNNVVVKAKSHVGLHYWPSQYGRMHEGLKRRNLDYVGEMIKACRGEGISVTVYFSQIYDNYAYDTQPTWRMVNSNGVTSREHGGRYGYVCPNNMAYRAYGKEILEELLDRYDYDGMFLDMPFWPEVCYCADCRARFIEETGHDIPRNGSLNNEVWVDFLKRRQVWLEEYVAFNSQVIKAKKPHVSIEHNFAAVGAGWAPGDTEKILDACDYAGGDYYGGYHEQTFMCKYYNNVTPSKPFVYITSRCDPNLYAHTVSRCKEDLMIHTVNALVHNGAFSMCDAMNPDGTITEDVYTHQIGPTYAWSQNYEQYMSGEMNADASIWYNTNLKVNDNFISSPMAVARTLQNYNMLYDVVGTRNLDQIKTPVLCIHGVYDMTDQEMAAIEKYIVEGGKVFITGKLPHTRWEALLEAQVKGESEYGYTYLTPTALGAPLFETFDQASPYPLERTITEYEIAGTCDVLATLSYPYTKRASRDFSAIHSNPPGVHTQMPAVVEKTVGKGKILWSMAPLELTPAHFCRKAVYSLVRHLVGELKLESNAPAYTEVTSWEKDGMTYIGVVNQQDVYPVYQAQGITITLPYACKEVVLKTESDGVMTVDYAEHETTITLPSLEIFHLLQINR